MAPGSELCLVEHCGWFPTWRRRSTSVAVLQTQRYGSVLLCLVLLGFAEAFSRDHRGLCGNFSVSNAVTSDDLCWL
jgi:hypothetical protein